MNLINFTELSSNNPDAKTLLALLQRMEQQDINTDELRLLLTSRDQTVREKATSFASELGQSATPVAIDYPALLGDSSVIVRRNVVMSLACDLGPDSAEAVRAASLLLRDSDAHLRSMAVRLLCGISDETFRAAFNADQLNATDMVHRALATVTLPLADAIHAQHMIFQNSDTASRIAVLIAAGKSCDALETLYELCASDTQVDMRASLAWASRRCAACFEHIIGPLLVDCSDVVRASALESLFGTKAPKGSDGILWRIVQTGSAAMKWRALVALRNMGGKVDIPYLEVTLLLKDSDTSVRKAASQLLEKLHPVQDVAFAARCLLDVIEDEENEIEVRRRALSSLRKLPGRDLTTASVLVHLAADTNSEIRFWAVVAIRDMIPADDRDEIKQCLMERVRDMDADVRGVAWQAVRTCGIKDRECVEVLDQVFAMEECPAVKANAEPVLRELANENAENN